ncbi:MAG: 2-oxo acid dehydrogenase subunit E2 [Bacteroidetes bacterium]|nr:2-oxo acid dehydrogenase subunit E2 [Bacteroidota bacterium]
MIEFVMPSLGADMEDGILVEWHKKKGDAIKRGDIIADVETQKGLIEIEVFEDGVIEKLLIEPDTKVPVGTPLALINPTNKKAETIISTDAQKEASHPIAEKEITPTLNAVGVNKKIKISPLAKRVATENNINFSTLLGSGENGAITKEDVEKAIAQKQKSLANHEASGTTTEDKTKNASNSIRAAVAAAMSKSNREIPHYYLEKTIDMTKALAWMNRANKERSVKQRLLPAALLIKAVAISLREVPELNAIWDNGLQIKSDINIGFVVSLRGGGIIVPAIHAANLKTIDEIMSMLNDIIPRAKALKLRSSELSDSSITITSIGEGGADSVYGIIYPPQVAIIGFGNISEQPFAENGMLGIHPLVHVTLAADHRAIDGLTGSRFLTVLNTHLQNPESL